MIKVSCKGSTFVTHHTQVRFVTKQRARKEPKANAYSENPTTDYSSANKKIQKKPNKKQKQTNKNNIRNDRPYIQCALFI